MNFKQSNIQEKIFTGILVRGLLYLFKEMGGLKYQISLLFFISTFILVLLNREEYAIYALIFVLPFQAAPFRNSEFPYLHIVNY